LGSAAAAREIVGDIPFTAEEIKERVAKAARYTELGQVAQTIVEKIPLAGGIVEFKVRAPMVARSAKAGQFVRVLGWDDGELIPLTLADWDAERRYELPGVRVEDPKACQCGEVLKGVLKPWECKVFGTACTPETPIGTCMVSSEGACAAYYNFGRKSFEKVEIGSKE